MKSKENKRDFHLGGMQEEGESKGLLPLRPSRRHKKCMCKRKLHKKKERAAKSESFREKKTVKREIYC